MLTPEELFITDYVDLYRFGNSVSPRLDHIRPSKDAKIQDRNGIKYIVADGNGISAFSSAPIGKGHAWKFCKGTPLPIGIKLVIDKRPNHTSHYMLAPEKTMKLSEFHALMDKLREFAIKVS